MRDRRFGNPQMLLQTRDLLEVDRPDDIDNRELAGLTRNDCKARHLVIVEGDVYVYVLVLLPIMYLRQLTPNRRRQLGANRIDIGL